LWRKYIIVSLAISISDDKKQDGRICHATLDFPTSEMGLEEGYMLDNFKNGIPS
jgi:hypothetical protein